MKIAIIGVSGFIGSNIRLFLIKQGYDVIPVYRNDLKPEILKTYFENVDVVLNFAGEPVNGYWTKRKKERIYKSRIYTGKLVVEAINKCNDKPGLLINASAIGIYEKGKHNEQSIFFSNNFLANTVKDWEKQLEELKSDKTRVVVFRMGIVLGNKGFLRIFAFPYNFKIATLLGSGEESFPFIHIEDLLGIVSMVIEKKNIKGILNVVSPQNACIRDLNEIFNSLFKPWIQIRIPDCISELILGESIVLLKDNPVVIPEVLMHENYSYKFRSLEEALKNIVSEK